MQSELNLIQISGEDFLKLLDKHNLDDSHFKERFEIIDNLSVSYTDEFSVCDTDDIKSIHSVVTIKGYLHAEEAKVQCFHNLQYVGCSIDARDSNIVSFPSLTTVNGWFEIDDSKVKNLPVLKSVHGCFFANNSDIVELPELENVGEHFAICNTRLRSAPKLKEIGGYLLSKKSLPKVFPALKKIGENPQNIPRLWDHLDMVKPHHKQALRLKL